MTLTAASEAAAQAEAAAVVARTGLAAAGDLVPCQQLVYFSDDISAPEEGIAK